MKSVLAFLGVLGACGAFGINIVQNPGFETGELAPWISEQTPEPGDPWVISNLSHSGAFSATVESDETIVQHFADIDTNTIVGVSFWLRNTDMQEAGVNLHYSDGTLSPFVAYLSSLGWEYFDLTRVLQRDKRLSWIQIYGHVYAPRPNTTYLDDVAVEVVPEPVSLFSLGTLTLLLLMKTGKKKLC